MCVLAEHKHVDEIDPRSASAETTKKKILLRTNVQGANPLNKHPELIIATPKKIRDTTGCFILTSFYVDVS